jgi:hypothetical protein
MSTSAGLLIFFTIYRQAVSEQNGTVGLASALIVAAVGAGFFIASRFVAPPSVATRARAVD